MAGTGDTDLITSTGEDPTRRYDAARWLRKIVGVVLARDLPAEPSEEDFRQGLKSGMILCTVINKIQAGAVPKIVEAPSAVFTVPDDAAQAAYMENITNFLSAVEEMGLPTFDPYDLEQGGHFSRVIDCLLALKWIGDCKMIGRNGSRRLSGNATSSPSGKQFGRRNSDSFMNSISRTQSLGSDKSLDTMDQGGDGSDVNEECDSGPLYMIVCDLLEDKEEEDIPIIVENILNKVTEEFESRLVEKLQKVVVTTNTIKDSSGVSTNETPRTHSEVTKPSYKEGNNEKKEESTQKTIKEEQASVEDDKAMKHQERSTRYDHKAAEKELLAAKEKARKQEEEDKAAKEQERINREKEKEKARKQQEEEEKAAKEQERINREKEIEKARKQEEEEEEKAAKEQECINREKEIEKARKQEEEEKAAKDQECINREKEIEKARKLEEEKAAKEQERINREKEIEKARKQQEEEEEKAAKEQERINREKELALQEMIRQQEEEAEQERINREKEMQALQEAARKEAEERAAREQERIKREQELLALKEKLRKQEEEGQAITEQERINREKDLLALQEMARREEEDRAAREQERIKREKEIETLEEKARKEEEDRTAKEQECIRRQQELLELQEQARKEEEEIKEQERIDRENELLAQQERARRQEEYKKRMEEYDNLNARTATRKVLIQQQHKQLQDLRSTFSTAKTDLQSMQTNYQEEVDNLGKHVGNLCQAAAGYKRVLEENRKLYNQVQDLKGSIRVYCRVRPFLPGQEDHLSSVDYTDEETVTIIIPGKTGKESRKASMFNKVFGPSATQEEVFSDTQPLIRSVLDGFNVCIFAYGQTGSGKTYTMTGPDDLTPETMGVNCRALSDLFLISDERKDLMSYEISVNMLEIYNDEIRDLLVTDGTSNILDIQTGTKTGINVPDANRVPVTSTDEVINLMNLSKKNRQVSSTPMNDRSSRSHSFLTVHVLGKDLTSGTTTRGCMHLVDLAGNEKLDNSDATEDQINEETHINKSLSALGDVLVALAHKSSRVSYKSCKLTQLLQDALGGQAKILMFVHIHPDVNQTGETLSTFKFTERYSTVEGGAGKSAEVRELKEHIAYLKSALAAKKETGDSQEVRSSPGLQELSVNSPTARDSVNKQNGGFEDESVDDSDKSAAAKAKTQSPKQQSKTPVSKKPAATASPKVGKQQATPDSKKKKGK